MTEPAPLYQGATLKLKPGREKSLLRRHPWVFSGAVAGLSGGPALGATMRVVAADGRFLAWAAYSPASQIAARVWTFNPEEVIDERFIANRIASALAYRNARLGPLAPGRARRLVNAEADDLPGLIVDAYGPVAVIQCLAAGAERWRDAVAAAIAGGGFRCLYERSDAEVRELEGLPLRVGALRGVLPEEPVEIAEGEGATEITLLADVVHGHKTGMYLDQASNRALLAGHSQGRRVLNCFAYTGAFSIACLAGGAEHVVSIESAREAIALGQLNEARNAVAPQRSTWTEGDVFVEMRRLRDARRQFELIILDPPKFAPTHAHVDRAARAYKDINLLAFKLLAPGGLLATFSCSAAIDASLFRRIVAGAAEDAGSDAIVRGPLTAAADHPVRLGFPEGDYLKGLLLQKV